MTNRPSFDPETGLSPAVPTQTAEIAPAITRGVVRLMVDCGFAPLAEFQLPSGRRADIAAIDDKGQIIIVEIKSCENDFRTDRKWHTYLDYCDRYYFAVAEGFPLDLLPTDQGLIRADRFGGAILREGPVLKLAAARRKALTLRFARQAALRGCRPHLGG